MKQKALPVLSFSTGFFLFILSFSVHDFIYSELCMALSIVLILSGMHFQCMSVTQEPMPEVKVSFISNPDAAAVHETGVWLIQKGPKEPASI
jgi:hypothetical protein